MSIQSEIDRISGNVNDTLGVLSDAGVAVPAGANSDNLPELVNEAVNAVIPVARGGTGATTEYEAANNLGVWSFLGGAAIPAYTDLNSLITPGNYYCANSSTVQTLINCPIDLAFTLKVFYPVGNASYIAQELMDYNTGARYYRLGRSSDGTWWDWQTYYMSANKPALDELSGTLPISKGGTGATTASAAANSLGVPTLLSGTSIPANSDLNTYTTVGNYCCPTDSATRTLANCPVDRAFNMRVFYAWGESWAVAQELANGNTGVRYYRWCSKSAGVWTAWQGDYTTANKPTPADIGAASKAELEEVKTSVSEGKALIASAVTDKGVETADNATFAQMAANIAAIPSGGSAPNLGSITVTPADYDQIFYASNEPVDGNPDNGFYDGFSYFVVEGDENLVPENIVAGASIFGVYGTAAAGEGWGFPTITVVNDLEYDVSLFNQLCPMESATEIAYTTDPDNPVAFFAIFGDPTGYERFECLASGEPVFSGQLNAQFYEATGFSMSVFYFPPEADTVRLYDA